MAVSPLAETRAAASPPPPEKPFLRRAGGFLLGVVSKAEEDNIFFMAGAITFNFLVAVVPLLLLILGVSGFVLTSRFPDPGSVLVPFLLGNLPEVGGEVDLASRVQALIDTLLADRRGLSVVGAVVLLWVSTRLVATLRTTLREVFDFTHGRGIVQGKLFDALMVMVGGVLFILNVGITVLMETVEAYGVDLLRLRGPALAVVSNASAHLLALISIWLLFLLVYRYLPPRRIPWRTALVAATFTGVFFEAAKYLFSWYVTSVADLRSTYGGLTAAAVLFFWIYYGAVVFILGGEVAQVYTMNRVRRLHAARAWPGVGE